MEWEVEFSIGGLRVAVGEVHLDPLVVGLLKAAFDNVEVDEENRVLVVKGGRVSPRDVVDGVRELFGDSVGGMVERLKDEDGVRLRVKFDGREFVKTVTSLSDLLYYATVADEVEPADEDADDDIVIRLLGPRKGQGKKRRVMI